MNVINQHIDNLDNKITTISNLSNNQNKNNNQNRTSYISNFLKNIQEEIYNDRELLNREIVEKLKNPFISLHNDIRKIAKIEQNIDNNVDHIYVYTKITHNHKEFKSILMISFIEKKIYIINIKNNTDIRKILLYFFLYINYILLTLYDYDISEIIDYKLELFAEPQLRTLVNRTNISTNNRNLYKYYESYGFQLLSGKKYLTTYSNFIIHLYSQILKIIHNQIRPGSSGSSASSSSNMLNE
jgi:hypothetical protein